MRQFPRKQDEAQVYQPHHQTAGDDECRLQPRAQAEHGGRERVHQKGIAQQYVLNQRVLRRIGAPLQARGDAQVQAEVAVGRLPHVQGPVHLAQRVRVLQVDGKDEQRHDQRDGQPGGHVPAEGASFALQPHRVGRFPQKLPRQQREYRRQPQRRILRRRREFEQIGKQRRQPHHHQKPRRQPQPQAHDAVPAPEQRVRKHIAADLKPQQQQNSAHDDLRESHSLWVIAFPSRPAERCRCAAYTITF